jgi:hypothetical protein
MMNDRSRHIFVSICSCIVGLGILNLIVFVAITFYIGGDAIGGKREQDRYYVYGSLMGSRKEYHEVSASIYHYSRVHALMVIGSWPVVIAALIAANRMEKSPTRETT